MKPSLCKACGYLLEETTDTSPDKRLPLPGDVSLCFNCGHLQIFSDNLSLRDPTDEEIYDLAGDPEMLRAQKARGFIIGIKRRTEEANDG